MTKEKILFPCCNVLALGFRGAHRTVSGIFHFAQCPKCGKRLNLRPFKKS